MTGASNIDHAPMCGVVWCGVVGHANTSSSHLFRVSLTRQTQEIWQPPPQSFNIQYFIALT